MERHEKYIGIEQIVDYLYSIGIDDENEQDKWIHHHLNYKTYSLSDESALFVYNYFDEYLDGMDIEKNITYTGRDALFAIAEKMRPESGDYEKPY